MECGPLVADPFLFTGTLYSSGGMSVRLSDLLLAPRDLFPLPRTILCC
jgi:hypothetical protein